MGETYDIVGRTAAHHQRGQKPEEAWQVDLIEAMNCKNEAEKPVLYVFGSKEFSRSMTLDLENTLYTLLESMANQDICIRNGRGNPQSRYSNCDHRNAYLEKIWEVLRPAMENILPEFSQLSAVPAEAVPTPGDQLAMFAFRMQKGFSDLKVIPQELRSNIQKGAPTDAIAALEGPAIYMHLWEDADTPKQYHIYVGETTDLIDRTDQHLTAGESDSEPKNQWKTNWRRALGCDDRLNIMFVWGHPAFNKSMTLDLENRLINYCICLGRCSNGRTNEQRNYHNKAETQGIFEKIVAKLCELVPTIFRPVRELQEQSVFLASPILKLTEGQEQAKTLLLDKTEDILRDPQQPNRLLMAQGGAGTGKTVLAANLFFHLYEQGWNCHFIVNNDELLLLYQKMAATWKLSTEDTTRRVWKAEEFINHFQKGEDACPDVIIVDEAHLLYTQGHFGKGALKAQLPELYKLARVTILMFDPKQVMKPGQYWDTESLQWLKNTADCVNLTQQLRMCCDEETMEWILGLSEEGEIKPLPEAVSGDVEGCFTDRSGYELRVFDSPGKMEQALKLRREEGNRLSCMLATYDWAFYKNDSLGSSISIPEKDGTTWIAWWNDTGNSTGMSRRIWTESSGVKTDVGAVHDIQGFDLEYAGVILGNSVQYKNGKIVFDPELRQERVKNRTLSDGSKKDVSKELLSNELFVLLTRATKGLYLYACDPALREALQVIFDTHAVSGNEKKS